MCNVNSDRTNEGGSVGNRLHPFGGEAFRACICPAQRPNRAPRRLCLTAAHKERAGEQARGGNRQSNETRPLRVEKFNKRMNPTVKPVKPASTQESFVLQAPPLPEWHQGLIVGCHTTGASYSFRSFNVVGEDPNELAETP